MIKRILWLLLLLPLSLAAAQTGYKIVHPDGTVEFTDDPHRGGEPIELKEAPTFKSLPARPPSFPPAVTPKPEAKKVSRYQSISITSPKPGQTFWYDGTGINFMIDIQPPLNGSDEIVIELDGKEVARGKENSFIVNGIYRGEHQVAAEVVDSKGETVLKSAPVSFYMQRHTTNKP